MSGDERAEVTFFDHRTGETRTLGVGIVSVDAGQIVATDAYGEVDRFLNPWNYSDALAWPALHLFPRLERARIAASVAAGRVRDAWSVLRGAETIRDDWEDQQ